MISVWHETERYIHIHSDLPAQPNEYQRICLKSFNIFPVYKRNCVTLNQIIAWTLLCLRCVGFWIQVSYLQYISNVVIKFTLKTKNMLVKSTLNATFNHATKTDYTWCKTFVTFWHDRSFVEFNIEMIIYTMASTINFRYVALFTHDWMNSNEKLLCILNGLKFACNPLLSNFHLFLRMIISLK